MENDKKQAKRTETLLQAQSLYAQIAGHYNMFVKNVKEDIGRHTFDRAGPEAIRQLKYLWDDMQDQFTDEVLCLVFVWFVWFVWFVKLNRCICKDTHTHITHTHTHTHTHAYIRIII